VRVEGVVTLDGKPVERAVVEFIPQRGRGAREANALTRGDGTFEMETLRPGDGVWPGDYKILVTKKELPPEPPPSRSAAGMAPRPERFLRENPGGPSRASREKMKNVLPARYGDATRTPLRCRVPPDGKLLLELRSPGGS
jgi:hypothetical protein